MVRVKIAVTTSSAQSSMFGVVPGNAGGGVGWGDVVIAMELDIHLTCKASVKTSVLSPQPFSSQEFKLILFYHHLHHIG